MNNFETSEEKQRGEIVLSVYFSGTGHEIETERCLAGFLYANNAETDNQLRLGFSGCGITHGLRGTLFGNGLKEQCQVVKKQVLDLIKQGKKVKLNCYGHSRGGIAALLLAKLLGDFDEDILEINLALLDTVPGNLLVTQKIDFLGLTLANQAMDLSKCHNLKRVLSLYTNIPLPDLAAHAPLLPKYPQKTQIVEDVLPGCHAGVQFQRVVLKKVYFDSNQCLLAFAYISNFLKACGTKLHFLGKLFFDERHNPVKIEDATLKRIYAVEKQKLSPEVREGHSYRSATIKTDSTPLYLNKQHQKLEQEDKMMDADQTYALSIEPPLSPRIARPERNYTAPEMSQLFSDFLADLLNGLSKESKDSEKGTLITQLQYEINQLTDRAALKNALRNALALVLQRDRYAYSLFSTTKGGYTAKALLNMPKYQAFAELVLGSATHPLRYRDLRMFVLGENQESYFNAKNRDRTYKIVRESKLTTDNLSAYLRKGG